MWSRGLSSPTQNRSRQREGFGDLSPHSWLSPGARPARPWRVALGGPRTGPACNPTQEGRGLQSAEPQATIRTWGRGPFLRGLSRGLLMASSVSLGVSLAVAPSADFPVPRSSRPQPDLGPGTLFTGLGSASPPTKSHLPGPEGVGQGQSIQRRWKLGTAGSGQSGLASIPFSKAGSGLEWRHQVPTPSAPP